jgi:hypothetical protein
MKIISNGKLSDITHVSHFPILYKNNNLKSFNKTRNRFFRKIEKKNRVLMVLGIWRENHISKVWRFSKDHSIFLQGLGSFRLPKNYQSGGHLYPQMYTQQTHTCH